jgi:pimeloyl-ACP methyl ester carboxylesterase
MARQADPVADVDPRLQRYRQAEAALWEQYGVEPTEQFIDLDSPRVRLRVVEVGSGDPIVFIGGTGGTGPYWAPLVRELAGFRCVMVDRPGWGLSSSMDYSQGEYKTVVADVLRAPSMRWVSNRRMWLVRRSAATGPLGWRRGTPIAGRPSGATWRWAGDGCTLLTALAIFAGTTTPRKWAAWYVGS